MREAKIIIRNGSVFRNGGFSKEENLELLATKNATALFGDVITYINLKKRITSLGKVTKIPDGILLAGSTIKNTMLWIVEYELADHPLESHIFPQVTGFVTALRNERTKRQLRDEIYSSIRTDRSAFKKLRSILSDPDPDIRYFLESVIENKLGIVIVINERTDELDEIASRIAMGTAIPVRILEFARYENDRREEILLADALEDVSSGTVRPPVKKLVLRRGDSMSKNSERVDGMTNAVKIAIRSYQGKVFDVKEVFDKVVESKLVTIPAHSDMDELYHNYRAVIYHLKVDGKIRKVDPSGHSGEYQQVKEL